MITVTPMAIEKLKEILEEQGQADPSLRVIAMPGPHGGLHYMLALEEKTRDGDVAVTADGLKFLVDADSAPLVEGAEIDWVEGLMRSGFVITNPNFSAEGCACGGNCACGGQH